MYINALRVKIFCESCGDCVGWDMLKILKGKSDNVVNGLNGLKAKRETLIRDQSENVYLKSFGYVAECMDMTKIAVGENSHLFNALDRFFNHYEEVEGVNMKDLINRLERLTYQGEYFEGIIDACISQVNAVGAYSLPKESKNVLGEVGNDVLVGILFSIITVSFLAGFGVQKFFNDEKPQQPIYINVPPSTYIVPYSSETRLDTIKPPSSGPQSQSVTAKSDSIRSKQ